MTVEGGHALGTVGTDPPIEPRPSIDLGRGLSDVDAFFTENIGQLDERAGRFYCIGRPLSVAFGDGWVAYAVSAMDGQRGHMYRVRFEGALRCQPVGAGEMVHRSNFFIGNDPAEWHTSARSYRAVEFQNLYDGITLKYYFKDHRLKYDFIVEPFHDPSVIRMRYEAVGALRLDAMSGDLLVETPVGSVIDLAPSAFLNGLKEPAPVACAYRMVGATAISFTLDGYDEASTLTIDPGLLFSTYLGGSWYDYGTSMVEDEDGNIVMTGQATSVDFPIVSGAYDSSNNFLDGFVTKMRYDGKALISSTFIGGSDEEYPRAVNLDDDNNIYVTGLTRSTNFPTTQGALQRNFKGGDCDCFVAKLNPDGSALDFSTYYGGTYVDSFYCVEVDAVGSVYLCGVTQSDDIPMVPGCYDTEHSADYDVMLVKMASDGTRLIYSTYIGGYYREVYPQLRIDGDGNAYVAMTTGTPDLPTTPSAFQARRCGEDDVYVIKLNADCTAPIYSTYIGGAGYDILCSMYLDNSSRVYVGGMAHSGFPTTTGAYMEYATGKNREAFIGILSDVGTTLEYGTLFSGNTTNGSRCFGIKRTTDDEIMLLLETAESDLPVTADAFDLDKNGGLDIYVGRLNITAACVTYGTYLGGSQTEQEPILHVGKFYVTVYGRTESSDFPTTTGAYDESFGSPEDAFLTRIDCAFLGTNITVPSPPRNVTIENLDRSLLISWEAPSDLGGLRLFGYRIYGGPSEDSLTLLSDVGPDILEFLDRPSVLGTRHYYAVSAYNLRGESDLSAIVSSVVVGPPTEPLNLTATPGCRTVALVWEPPLNCGALPIRGYLLYRGATSVDPPLLVSLENVTSHTDEGLENGRAYFYMLRAFNAAGNGTATPVISVIPLGPPTAPRNLKVISVDGQLTIEWRPPVSDGGMTLAGYRIHKGTSPAGLHLTSTVPYYTTNFTDAGLSNGVKYHYSVQAWNVIGAGPLSDIINGTPLGRPDAPLELTAKAGDGTVTLSWLHPEHDGGMPVLGYHVQRGTSPDRLSWLADTVDTTYADPGLMNGMALYYRVTAFNGVGDGPTTSVVVAIPMGLCEAPTGLVAEPGNGLVTFSWLIPIQTGGSEIERFVVYRGMLPDALGILCDLGPTAKSYTDRTVVVGTTYHYAVAAVTAAGEGRRSVVVSATPFGPPGMPLDLSATAGDGKVSLSWKAPGSDGGSAIDGFVVLRGITANNLLVLEKLADMHVYTDRAVQNGVTYFYAVAAKNAAGQGVPSAIVNATPFKSVIAPGKVANLIFSVKDGKVTLQWTAPASDGGSPLIGYVVLRGTSANNMTLLTELGTVTSHTDATAKRGTIYYYTVVAKNAVGQGEPFAAQEVKVPKAAKKSPGLEAPAALLALAAVLILITSWRRHVRVA